MAIGIDATRIDRRVRVRHLDVIAGHDDPNRPVQIRPVDVQSGDGPKVGERAGVRMAVPVAGTTGDDRDHRADGAQEVGTRARIGPMGVHRC
jgi:hypothetical protein